MEQDHRQLVGCLVVHSRCFTLAVKKKKSGGLLQVAFKLFRRSCSRIAPLLLPHKQTLGRGKKKKHISNTFRMEAPRGKFCICSDSVEVGSVTASNPHVILPKHSHGKKKKVPRRVSSSCSVCTFCPSATRYQTRADRCQVCP